MIAKVLAGAVLALMVTAGLMAWHIKAQNESIGRLEHQKTQLSIQLQDAARINADLSDEIDRMRERNQETLKQMAATEADKRRLAAELDKRNADLRRALRDQPDWATTPVPGPIAAGVNAAVDRVRNTAAYRDYPG